MSRNHDSKAIQRALQRAAKDPFFLASALDIYCSLNDLDTAGLADYLGCSAKDVVRLAFCRRPRTDVGTFRGEVDQIAAYLSISAEKLASLLRQVDALEALRKSPTMRTGFLMAAREHEERDGGESKLES